MEQHKYHIIDEEKFNNLLNRIVKGKYKLDKINFIVCIFGVWKENLIKNLIFFVKPNFLPIVIEEGQN